jgi:hypothetical protein
LEIKVKLNLQVMMVLVAIIAFIVFLYHVVAPAYELPEPSDNAVYWFLLAFMALIFPYIREIKLKDFTFIFQKMEESKNMLKAAINELEEARLRFDKTREELVFGYFEYLNSLPEKKKIEKKIYLTKLYLEGMSLSEHDLMVALNSIDNIDCVVADKLTAETLKAIEQFQANNGLIPDGVFGYQTYAKLLEITRKP